MNLKERILTAEDIGSEILDVPEWGVKIEIRSMTGAERGEVMRQWSNEDGSINYIKFYPAVVTACCFDPETGERVFDLGDAEAINAKSSAVLEKIAAVGMRLSGLDAESRTRAEGNSTRTTTSSTPNGDSPTT